MTGANYMGGKRNAARARIKDTCARVQKGHFGRQRFSAILSKTQDTGISFKRKNLGTVLSEMDLAHAHRGGTAKIYEPSLVTPKTKVSKKSHSTPSSCSSSSGTKTYAIKYSKVLEIIDTTEPSSLQAEIARILSIPDLAGLSGIAPRVPAPPVNAKCSSKQDSSLNSPRNSRSPSVKECNLTSSENSVLPPSSGDFMIETKQNSLPIAALTPPHGQGGLLPLRCIDTTQQKNTRLDQGDRIRANEDEDRFRWLRSDSSVYGHDGFEEVDSVRLKEQDMDPTKDLRTNMMLSQYWPSPSNTQSYQSRKRDTSILNLDTSPASTNSAGRYQIKRGFLGGPSQEKYQDIDERGSEDEVIPDDAFVRRDVSHAMNSTGGFFGNGYKNFSLTHQMLADDGGEQGPHENPLAIDRFAYLCRNYAECTPPFMSSKSQDLFDSPEQNERHPPDVLPVDVLSDPDPWATIGKILNLGEKSGSKHDLDSKSASGQTSLSDNKDLPGDNAIASSGIAMDWLRMRREAEPIFYEDVSMSLVHHDDPQMSLDFKDTDDTKLTILDGQPPLSNFSALSQDGETNQLTPQIELSLTNQIDHNSANYPDSPDKCDAGNQENAMDTHMQPEPARRKMHQGPCLFSDPEEGEDM